MVPAERLGEPCPLHPSLLPGASVASQVASLRTQQTRKVGALWSTLAKTLSENQQWEPRPNYRSISKRLDTLGGPKESEEALGVAVSLPAPHP